MHGLVSSGCNQHDRNTLSVRAAVNKARVYSVLLGGSVLFNQASLAFPTGSLAWVASH